VETRADTSPNLFTEDNEGNKRLRKPSFSSLPSVPNLRSRFHRVERSADRIYFLCSLYAWDGSPGTGNVAAPQKLIDELGPYSTRPEGVDLIQIDGQWRVIFVEDRYRAKGYGTRNAVHWPISILGTVE
jgi:hypothetical protein